MFIKQEQKFDVDLYKLDGQQNRMYNRKKIVGKKWNRNEKYTLVFFRSNEK
jgi:hypothetical protein